MEPYLPPEASMNYENRDIFKENIWSIGVIFFELLNGRLSLQQKNKLRETKQSIGFKLTFPKNTMINN